MPEKPDAEKNYQFLEHTADIGLRIWGQSEEELFWHAAQGLYALALHRMPQAEQVSRSFQLQAEDPAALLLHFLQELTFILYTEKLAAVRMQFKFLTPTNVQVQSQLEHLAPENFSQEVKSPTYHRLQVKSIATGWEAEVYFDL